MEWHNAYLHRVTQMPSLPDLLKPLKAEEQEEQEEQQGLDPVGRDLMNALLSSFRPKFDDDTPKEE